MFRYDLRDRVKAYAAGSNKANLPSPDERSPTNAFFGRRSAFANQMPTRQAPVHRPQKRRQVQCEPEKQPIQQEQRSSLSALQANQAPLAKELIDRVISNSDSIYGEALTKLSGLYKELANIIAETSAEDDRILNLVETNHKKTTKLPSNIQIHDERTNRAIHVGERVAFVKGHIDTVEAEVVSLWDQWETAQKTVDDIFAELKSDQGDKGVQPSSLAGVQKSLAAEMAKFGEELIGILEVAHEEARASEKGFARNINAVMSALLQQYLLED